MKTKLPLLMILTWGIAATAGPAPAQADDPAARLAQAQANEQRLRETLRATTQQLRTAEAEKAGLLADQAGKDARITELETRLAALTRQSAEDKAAADRKHADLRQHLTRREQESARLAASLEKWKQAWQQVSAVARKSQAAQLRLESANAALEQKAALRETQNLELHRTGREILRRYADFGLGRALAAREPFTGIAKARLEEQIQDYADRLEDHKIKPVPSDGRPSTRPAPAGPPAPSASGSAAPARPAPAARS